MILSMITKDSLRKVGVEDFKRVWDASLQVPYRSVILVDDSQTEDTRRFVKEFTEAHGKELVVERSRVYGWHKPTRATARQTAIDIFFENFSDEWLFFLDDDFVLRAGWWEEASQYVKEPRVGLVWGVDYTPRWVERRRWLSARGISEYEYAVSQFKIRGGLHDTLLRRKAIEGLRIPPWLHVYEDAWVKKYVECGGWEWRVVKTGGDHLRADASGYTQDDLHTMIKTSAMLRLENITVTSLLKALAGLPAYLYYAHKAYGDATRGFEIWKSRVYYRFKLLTAKKGDPCRVVGRV